MLTARRLAAGLLVFGLLAPALPAQAADVELQGLCGDYGDHVEYWAEAHRRHSEEGTLSVRISSATHDVGGDADPSGEFGKDPKRGGSAGPGQSGGPQFGMWIWQVPQPQKGDPAIGRRVGRINKPRGEKYFIEVKFEAPDAFVALNHDCEK